MRANLPHPLAERRPSRRRRPAAEASAIQPPADLAVQRVRDAGGPVDRASYSCACGYVFTAQVSTTVKCPRCEAGQAW